MTPRPDPSCAAGPRGAAAPARGRLPPRLRRPGRRRPGQRGLTLIELLIGLALILLSTAFLAGGLSIARRAAEADAVAETATRDDAALQAAVDLVETALPLQTVAPGTQRAALAFDGRAGSLAAILLGDGRSLRGGLVSMALRRRGDAVLVDVAPVREGADLSAVDGDGARHVTLFTGVRSLSLSYLDEAGRSAAASWHDSWDGARLPVLVAIAVDFLDPRRRPVAGTAVLRQR